MADELTYKQLLRDISSVEQEVSLGQFNGLNAGGRAAYFTVAHDAMELAGAVKAALDAGLPYEVVGAGTSVLFPDDGYAGLVIHNCSEGFIMAADRSQVVVESGMSLQRFITMAAGRGYGGITQFYGQSGTIGGAVYHNIGVEGATILSSVRHLTMLMPPTKMKPYPTVVRQRADWFLREDSFTRLQHFRHIHSFDQPRPVILNVQFQLTSVRPDELQRRIQREAAHRADKPKGAVFGPVFQEPGGEHTLEELLKYSGVGKLQVNGVRPDKHNLNYLRAKRGANAGMILAYVKEAQNLVLEHSGIEIRQYFERLGVWSNSQAEPVVG
jgi:UDP-N-acetylenolpyruvoylglucosamine reductase